MPCVWKKLNHVHKVCCMFHSQHRREGELVQHDCSIWKDLRIDNVRPGNEGKVIFSDCKLAIISLIICPTSHGNWVNAEKHPPVSIIATDILSQCPVKGFHTLLLIVATAWSGFANYLVLISCFQSKEKQASWKFNHLQFYFVNSELGFHAHFIIQLPNVVNNIWAHSPVSSRHMSVWYMFLDNI